MKIHASIREVYFRQRDVIKALKTQVDGALSAGKLTRWHYESRIKELESFAIKIESGRFSDPENLEDFLACTIVVPNSSSIVDAVKIVEQKFEVRYRRPPVPSETRKRADSFPFDDLRLFCARGNDGSRPEEPIDNVIFEVQIKTFLQHAWGIATHDLSYKTDDVRWGKDRIVAHLKAAIEFAELSIQQAEVLSHSPTLQLTQARTQNTAAIISILNTHWTRSELPENLRGLAETLQNILEDLRISTEELTQLLQQEKSRVGRLSINLSPYGVIIEILLNRKQEDIERMLKNSKSKTKLLITPEISLPTNFDKSRYPTRLVSIV